MEDLNLYLILDVSKFLGSSMEERESAFKDLSDTNVVRWNSLTLIFVTMELHLNCNLRCPFLTLAVET